MDEVKVHKGMRIMTGAGPGTVIRVFENEVHVNLDEYHALTGVYRPGEIKGPITQEQLDWWEKVKKKQPHRAGMTNDE